MRFLKPTNYLEIVPRDIQREIETYLSIADLYFLGTLGYAAPMCIDENLLVNSMSLSQAKWLCNRDQITPTMINSILFNQSRTFCTKILKYYLETNNMPSIWIYKPLSKIRPKKRTHIVQSLSDQLDFSWSKTKQLYFQGKYREGSYICRCMHYKTRPSVLLLQKMLEGGHVEEIIRLYRAERTYFIFVLRNKPSHWNMVRRRNHKPLTDFMELLFPRVVNIR